MVSKKFLVPIDYGTAELSSKLKTIGVTTPVLIDSFDFRYCRSVEYIVQLSQGVAFLTTKLMIVHDGTDVAISEYGTTSIGVPLIEYSFDGAFSFNNLELTLYCPTANVTPVVLKASKILFDV